MGQLRALQEELSQLLFVGANAGQSRFWPEGLPKRLNVYRNTVHGNCFDTLDSDFSLTRKQFTTESWDKISEEFFSKHRPSYWELNACIQKFPTVLSRKAPPAVVDLARYELADLVAYIDRAEVKKKLGRSNPTASPVVFQHQLFDWVWEKADPKKSPAQKPEVLVFYRDTKHRGRIRLADPLLLLLLDHYKRPGAKLEDAELLRDRILPSNKIPLATVLDEMVKNDLILL